MNKSQPSQATTGGIAAALLDAVFRLTTSRNPREQIAGYLLVAGCFLAYLVSAGRI
jgi:hypothetical protein